MISEPTSPQIQQSTTWYRLVETCVFLTVPWLWSYLISSGPAVRLINTHGSRKQAEWAPQEKNISALSSRIIVMKVFFLVADGNSSSQQVINNSTAYLLATRDFPILVLYDQHSDALLITFFQRSKFNFLELPQYCLWLSLINCQTQMITLIGYNNVLNCISFFLGNFNKICKV